MTILAACLIAVAALASGAALLGHSAAGPRSPRAAGTAAALTPASPLASSDEPRSARLRTLAPQSQHQQPAPVAAGGLAQPGTRAQQAAPSAAAPGSGTRCWSFGAWGQRDGDGTGWRCASSWRSRHGSGRDPWKR